MSSDVACGEIMPEEDRTGDPVYCNLPKGHPDDHAYVIVHWSRNHVHLRRRSPEGQRAYHAGVQAGIRLAVRRINSMMGAEAFLVTEAAYPLEQHEREEYERLKAKFG